MGDNISCKTNNIIGQSLYYQINRHLIKLSQYLCYKILEYIPMKVQLLLALLCIWVNSRRVIVNINPLKVIKKQGRIHYLTKFDIGEGQGSFRIRFKKQYNKPDFVPTHEIALKIGILKDSDFGLFEAAETCDDKKSILQNVIKTDVQGQSDRRSTKDLTITVDQTEKEGYWYLYAFDCDSTPQHIKEYGFDNIQFTIIMQNNGSHFGENENLIPQYVFLLVLWIMVFILYIKPIIRSIQETQLNLKVFIYVGFFVLFVGYLYQIINLLIIYFTGYDARILSIFASVIKHSIEGILVGVMISIAYGWSILTVRIDRMSIFLGIYMALGNIICSVLDTEDSADLHHHYDKISLPVILALRGGMVLSFVHGSIKTMKQSAGKINLFMQKYLKWGIVYLMGWPIAFAICQFCLPKQKHRQFLVLIEQSFHIIGNALMCHSLSIPTSAYKKVDKENKPLFPD